MLAEPKTVAQVHWKIQNSWDWLNFYHNDSDKLNERISPLNLLLKVFHPIKYDNHIVFPA